MSTEYSNRTVRKAALLIAAGAAAQGCVSSSTKSASIEYRSDTPATNQYVSTPSSLPSQAVKPDGHNAYEIGQPIGRSSVQGTQTWPEPSLDAYADVAPAQHPASVTYDEDLFESESYASPYEPDLFAPSDIYGDPMASLESKSFQTAPSQGVVSDWGAAEVRSAELGDAQPYVSPLSTDPSFNSVKSGSTSHIVVKGDTLYSLSQKYGVALEALAAANRISEPYTIKIGQEIRLPEPNVHLVGPDETLFGISERFNVDQRSLAVMNGLTKPWTIRPGDSIVLPVLAKDTAKLAALTEKFTQVVSSFPPIQDLTSNMPDVTGFSDAFVEAFTPKSVSSTQSPVKSSAGFAWPVNGHIARAYGEQPDGLRHEGLNIAAGRGTPFIAASDGEVVYAGDDLTGFGNLLLLRHANDWVSAYGHADRLNVTEGQTVVAGEMLGEVGQTGSVTSPQLFFQLRKGKKTQDPVRFLPARSDT